MNLKSFDGFLFIDRFKRCFPANTVGSEEGIAHVLPSPMLTLLAMHTRDGNVGANNAVTPQYHAGIGDAVAAKSASLTQHGPEFAQAAGYALTVYSQVHLTAVVAEIAEFGTRPKVDVFSENGVADVVEVGGFGARQENGMLHFGGMTDHSVGTNPRVFTHIGAASYDGPGADVAGTDKRRTRFHDG